MGAIVEFRGLISKSRRTLDPVPAEGAQILFFMGVRYERSEVPPAVKPRRKRGGVGASKKKPPRRRA